VLRGLESALDSESTEALVSTAPGAPLTAAPPEPPAEAFFEPCRRPRFRLGLSYTRVSTSSSDHCTCLSDALALRPSIEGETSGEEASFALVEATPPVAAADNTGGANAFSVVCILGDIEGDRGALVNDVQGTVSRCASPNQRCQSDMRTQRGRA